MTSEHDTLRARVSELEAERDEARRHLKALQDSARQFPHADDPPSPMDLWDAADLFDRLKERAEKAEAERERLLEFIQRAAADMRHALRAHRKTPDLRHVDQIVDRMEREIGETLNHLQEAHRTRQQLREALVGVLSLYGLYDEYLGKPVGGPEEPAIIAAHRCPRAREGQPGGGAMSKHTPTPWKAEPVTEPRFREPSPEAGDFYLVGADMICPGILWGPGKETEANAKFIVRAVNAHDALVNALEVLRDAEADRRRDGLGDLWPAGVRRMVGEALELAKGNTEAEAAQKGGAK